MRGHAREELAVAQERLGARSSAPRCARWRAPRRRCRTWPSRRAAAAASSTRPRSGPTPARPGGARRGRDRSGAGSSSRGDRRARRPAGTPRTRATPPGRRCAMPCMNQSISRGVARKMPRSTRPSTRSGCACAYASASVEPHDPPNTSQRSMPSVSRSRSRSATRCCVVLSTSEAVGVERAAAALVVEDDAEERRIVVATVMRQAAAAGAAVQEHERHAVGDCRTSPSASCAGGRARGSPLAYGSISG